MRLLCGTIDNVQDLCHVYWFSHNFDEIDIYYMSYKHICDWYETLIKEVVARNLQCYT